MRVTISAQMTIPPIFTAKARSIGDHQGIRFMIRTVAGDAMVKYRGGKVRADDLLRILQRRHEGDASKAGLDKFESRLRHWALAELTNIDLSEAAIEELRDLVKAAEGEARSLSLSRHLMPGLKP